MIKKIIQVFQTPENYAKKIGVNIGTNCSIMTKNFGSEPYLITIGDNVQITRGVSFFTHGGAWVYREESPDFDFFGKIVVKNNVYIGNNVLIMPGVTIESNVIVGAGSIVTKSVPEGKIVAGNPAKIIGDIKEYRKKIDKFNLNTKNMKYSDKKKILLNTHDNKFIKKIYL